MLHLNLIAEEAKRTIKYQRLYSLCLKTEGALLILLVLVGGIVLAAEKILSANIFQTSQQATALINSSSANYSAQVKNINDKIAVVAQIEGSYISYAQILRDFVVLIPENISLSFLSVDSENMTIELRGVAPTRQDLLDLEKNLKDSPWLINVNVPLEEKISQTNIILDITMKFDPAKIPSF